MAAIALGVAGAEPVSAGPAWGVFRGGGTTGEWRISGTMSWAEGQGTKGNVVATRRGAAGNLRCHWDTLTNGNVNGNVATFDAIGSCRHGSGDEVAVHNRFTVVDDGEPGAGRDAISVTGETVAFAGTISSGNLRVLGPGG